MQPTRAVSDELTHIPPGVKFAATLDTEGRIDSFAAEMACLLGCDARELTGEYVESLAHADVPTTLFMDMWSDLRAGRPWSGVIKYQWRNGEPCWARMTVVPVRTHGRVVSYIATFARALSREIESAAVAYQHVAERTDGSGFEHGRFAPGGLGGGIARRMNALSLRARLVCSVVLALVPTVLIAVLALLLVTERSATAVSVAIVFVVLSLLAGLLAGVSWWRLERRLANGLRFADSAVVRMVNGDFITPIDCGRGDEVGRLLQTLAELQVRLGLDVQRVNDSLHRPQVLDTTSEHDAEARSDALARLAAQLVSHAKQEVLRTEVQVSAIDSLIARVQSLSETGSAQGAVSSEENAAFGVERVLDTVSVELEAIDHALEPATDLLNDAELHAFELKLLALNFALARSRDERAGTPVLLTEARDRAHDAEHAFDSLKRMVGDLRTRLARGQSALSGTVDANLAPATSRPRGDEEGLSPALRELVSDLHGVLETIRDHRVVADQMIVLASELEAMLQAHPGAEQGGERVSEPTGALRAKAEETAAVARSAVGDESLKSFASSLRYGRTSAKISPLRPSRHEVGAPVPRVRRTAVQGTSIEDEWGAT